MICTMLFVATTINFMDRQVIGVLAPLLQSKIGWSDLQYSYIIGGFQFAYAIGLVLAGWIVDKIGTRYGYAIVIGVWSLAAMSHSLATGVLGFALARIFLGFGESGNFPCAIKTTAEWFPQKERSFATGIFNSGSSVGPILAPLLCPFIALRYGWQAAFLTTGIFSVTWMVLWLIYYRPPAKFPRISKEEYNYIHSDREVAVATLPWKDLFGYRQTWAFAVGKFLTDPIWWFYLFWLPSFLYQRFHLGLSRLGWPLVIIYSASVVGSVGGGWLPQLLNRGGMPMNKARLRVMFICACLALPIFFVCNTNSERTAVALLSLAIAAHQGWSANLFTTPSDMFPQAAVGSVTGIGGTGGSLGGVIFSMAVGWVLHLTHSYSLIFAISASAYLVALASICVLAPGLHKAEIRLQDLPVIS
jgi:ACS family hexuronate transporter-like MFS transporter